MGFLFDFIYSTDRRMRLSTKYILIKNNIAKTMKSREDDSNMNECGYFNWETEWMKNICKQHI